MIIKDILENKDVLTKLNNTQGMPSVVAYRIGKTLKLWIMNYKHMMKFVQKC